MLVTLDFVLSGLISFLKGWSKCASGQTAISTGLFHSKKHLIGGSLVLPHVLKILENLRAGKMERYKIIKEVGNGTFGSVWRAINKQTCEVVAIKKMKKKYHSWEDCLNLREVKSLRKMNHPNVVKLKEVIRENDMLYFVFEYMECNLYQMMMNQGQKPFSEAEVRNWCFQVFQGLAYMHQKGYFHRDLKPENLLITKDTIKIADFGLAREIGSEPPYTEYVSTRWYRAPEVLLQSSVYHSSVDMWAMGAIMAELFTLCPLFPGSSEADEIEKICSVIGSPNKYSWAEGWQLANAINYQFPQCSAVDIFSLIPSASENAISLIQALCSWDPESRPTAAEALQHPFFQSCFYVPPSLRSRAAVSRIPPSAGTRIYVEEKCTQRYRAPLPNSKAPGIITSGKITTSTTGFQRKMEMEMDKRDPNKSEKCLKITRKQPKCRPPARGSPTSNYACRAVRGDSDMADELTNMTIGTGRQALRQPLAPPLKAGGWHGHSDMFLGRPQDIQSGRTLSRKVAG